MKSSPFTVLMSIIGTILMVVSTSSCTRQPQPRVQDFDSFHIVNLGPLQYMTPNGVEYIGGGRGYAHHTVDDLEKTSVQTSVDLNPPRDIRLDADAERRRFLRDVPNGKVISTQYRKYDERSIVKFYTKGETDSGTPLFGTLTMIREGNDTATISLIGPAAHRSEIDNLSERIVSSASLTHGKKTTKKEMKEE